MPEQAETKDNTRAVELLKIYNQLKAGAPDVDANRVFDAAERLASTPFLFDESEARAEQQLDAATTAQLVAADIEAEQA